MTSSDVPSNQNYPREIAPFNPQASGPEVPMDEVAISVDELDNMIFVVLTLLSENINHSQEQRAAITILGAMQPHIATMKKHCSQ